MIHAMMHDQADTGLLIHIIIFLQLSKLVGHVQRFALEYGS